MQKNERWTMPVAEKLKKKKKGLIPHFHLDAN